MNRQGTSIQSRLGTKKGPGKPAIGSFDARNKIGKLRIEDARLKIQRKSGVQVQDLRERVEAGRGKKFDARQRIQQKQISKQTVVVTGLGRPLNSLQTPVTPLMGEMNITKTVDNPASQYSRFSKVSGQDGQLKIVSRAARVPEVPVERENPIIQIKNDLYKPSKPPTRAPAAVPRQQQARPRPKSTSKAFVPHVEFTSRGQRSSSPYDDDDVDMEEDATNMQEDDDYFDREHFASAQAAAPPVKRPSSQFQETAASGSSRVLITNLNSQVTQDDIVELFGAIGAMRKAKLLKAGKAEVIFTSQSSALLACRRYHMRELDGQPMQVVLAKIASESKPTPPVTVAKPQSKPTLKSSKTTSSGGILRGTAAHSKKGLHEEEQDNGESGGQVYEPLRLGKSNARGVKSLDMPLIHRALFKTTSSSDAPPRPVAFVVKI